MANRDFPAGPVVNTSPSNAEGAGSIPGRGAKIPYALWPRNQDINNISNIVTNWTSLVAQMLKRLPTMRETWVQSLGSEDLLEKEMATHSSKFKITHKVLRAAEMTLLVTLKTWGGAHTELKVRQGDQKGQVAAHQVPLSMGFSRKESWSGLPFPSPGDLPYPGIEPRSPAL